MRFLVNDAEWLSAFMFHSLILILELLEYMHHGCVYVCMCLCVSHACVAELPRLGLLSYCFDRSLFQIAGLITLEPHEQVLLLTNERQ